jgi:hypothetical protein
MQKIKCLIISKNDFFLIENSNIVIEEIFIKDATIKDPFYLSNIEFFIDKNIINVCFQIIQNFSLKELGTIYIKEISNVISNSNNLNFIINLLNHNYVVIKNPSDRFLSEDKVKTMFNKLIESNDPIIYLKTAIYYTGIRWINNHNITYKKGQEIEKIILSHDFKENDNAGNSNYVSLLIQYCKLFVKDRWEEVEKKIFNNTIWTKDYINAIIKSRSKDIEEKILEINDIGLYFNYYKNVLKKPWEDFKGNMNDKLIEAAISSIESNRKYAIIYSQETGRPLNPVILEEIITNLENTLNNGIGYAYEIGNSGLYQTVKMMKKRFPRFEKILLDYSDKNGGLKITGIPYEEDSDFLHYRTILDEAIYNYTITNRGGTWPEIGINNKDDLLKLRTQIVDHDTLSFRLKGYGDLDY